MKNKDSTVGVRMDEYTLAILDEIVQDCEAAFNAEFGEKPGRTVSRSNALRFVLQSLGRADGQRVGIRRAEFRKWLRAKLRQPLFG